MLRWDCPAHAARLFLDGEEIARMEQYAWALGVCYLRIRLLSAMKDEHGLLVGSVRATSEPD